jgi:hypothetical protein
MLQIRAQRRAGASKPPCHLFRLFYQVQIRLDAPKRLKRGQDPTKPIISAIIGHAHAITPEYWQPRPCHILLKPRKTILYLIFQTNDCHNLEKALHRVLSFRQLKVAGGSDEWFHTNCGFSRRFSRSVFSSLT